MPRPAGIPRASAARLTGVLMTLALVVAGCGGSGSADNGSGKQSLQHVNYLLAYLPDMISDHYLLAQHNGDFKKCGIDFEYKSAADVSNALQLLTSGGVDYAVVDPFTYISGLVKGLPIMAIGEEVARSGVTYVSLAKEGITGPQDLPGKTVGVSPGLDNELYLKQIMQQNLTPAQQTQVKLVPSGNSLQPLLTGQIDLSSEWFVNTDVQALVARGIKLNYLKALDYGIAVPGNVIVTTTKRISQDPQQVRRVLAATAAGQYESLDPANANLADRLVTKAMGASQVAPKGVEKRIFTQVQGLKRSPDWTKHGPMWNSADGYKQAEKFLVKAGQLKPDQVLPPSKLYTNKFLKEIYTPGRKFSLATACAA
jgi:ABC-type nitrate/sulfonate/bicarbonate transport system substrate-binding protein